MSHADNIQRCEKFKAFLITFLTNNNIWCENTKYPNLVLTRETSLKVVCPYTKKPMFLAVDADKELADLYVGFIYHENGRISVGFAYQSDLKFYPEDPDSGWENPTYRVLTEQLRSISLLLDVLKSNGGNYL